MSTSDEVPPELNGPSPLSVLIMAGGAGTRFWPLSTEARPKQFLSLLEDRSLLQASVDRVLGVVPPERILVLTGARFTAEVTAQLPALPAANVIGEPARRDTAAAVALGALLLEARHGPGVMAVLTADHRIEPVARFQAALRSAAAGARASPGALYTFGIKPTYAATAYGYLHRGERLEAGGECTHFRVQGFAEKPAAAVAERYYASGEHYWNSGMFVWSLGAIIAELERQLPGHVAALRPAVAHHGTPAFAPALERAFAGLDAVSVDYGVMEGARDVRCVEGDFEWSDVGGWLALEPFLGADAEGNAARARLHALASSRNIVVAEDPDEEVALVGVSGLVVVRAGNRTLVCSKEQAEAVKALVSSLPEHLR